MQSALRHRGPDGQGIAEFGRCQLVHTRLSIIDLLGGDQPMGVTSAVGGERSRELTLVFNGEIYNHRALRKQLEALGHRFNSSHCDTEVLVHGYRQWGTELPKHLHGMFAFAVYDASARSLFLCRDRMGKKPLYLRWSQDRKQLTFASLISAFAVSSQNGKSTGAPLRVSQTALLNYLRYGYTFEQSIIEGVQELPAAHWMTVDDRGRTQTGQYWQPPPISKNSTSLGAVRATRELIEDAVIKRLDADVPLGCFLSGGIDSSVIAAIANKELLSRGEPPLKTFCVAMPDIAYDESRFAMEVARHIGTHHTELIAEPHDKVIADVERLIELMGEPTADSSILPTFWLSRTTRDYVKVALSGDGGDELFGGYDRYFAMRWLRRWRGGIRRIPLSLLRSANPKSKRLRAARLVRAAQFKSEAQQYLSMIQLFSDEQITAMGFGDVLSGGTGVSPVTDRDGQNPPGVPDWPGHYDPAHSAMRWDLCHYLPFELLRKMDRASMAVALEVRCPLLDTEVCDLAGHLPTSVLMPGGRPKGLLRDVAADLGLPVSIVKRKKRGFALPIGQWFRGPLHRKLTEHILEGDLSKLDVNRYAVETLLEEHINEKPDHTHRLFALLMLSTWANRFL